MTATIDNKLENASSKASLWGSLVSAYSANKATKVGLLLSYAGLPTAIAGAAATYLGIKTSGAIAGYAANIARNPFKYLRISNIKKATNNTPNYYNPTGLYSRPTFIGSLLSGVTQYTGF